MRTIKEIHTACHVRGPKRPIWRGCDGALRIGHGGDTVAMLDDLRIPRHGLNPPKSLIEKPAR